MVTGSAGASSRASYVRDLSGTLATSIGTFSLSGAVTIVLPPNPVYPVDPVRPRPALPPNPVRATLTDTVATNEALTCRATGTASHRPTSGDTEITFTGVYRFYPTDPIFPVDPIHPCSSLGDLRVDFRITYGADNPFGDGGSPHTVTAQVVGVVT